ncbi:MAG: Plug domain-containing protein, partial [Flavobacteriales bacterium]|nr:Plug domain-containing protein [Flavobacteriales bacterium]
MNLLLNEISIHTTLNIEDNKTQIIRLNQKEITSSLSKNPAELLEKSTAISVQKSQNGGGSPNIRGFEANRILLVLDGVKLNNTIYRRGHLQNILSIDPFILENISIL